MVKICILALNNTTLGKPTVFDAKMDLENFRNRFERSEFSSEERQDDILRIFSFFFLSI